MSSRARFLLYNPRTWGVWMATTSQRVPRAPDLRPSMLKERRALLQRVLWSHQIEKSGRIRDLLAFVCEEALQDPGVEIHEQEIGSKVFGRNADYDTTIDNIVRVTASQARKNSNSISRPRVFRNPSFSKSPRASTLPSFANERWPQPRTSIHLNFLRVKSSFDIGGRLSVSLAWSRYWRSWQRGLPSACGAFTLRIAQGSRALRP